MSNLAQTEPVTLTAAVTAAVNTTLGMLAVFFEWDSQVSGGLLAASGAWITVFALLFARSQVTPNVNVALTKDEETLIHLGQAEEKAAAADAAAAPVPNYIDGRIGN